MTQSNNEHEIEPVVTTGTNHIAPPGTIWVCRACGKTARDSFNGPGGWDESCMLNAVLCYEQGPIFTGWKAVPQGETK